MANDPAEERRIIAQALGECIIGWAAVEKGLSILYGECVGAFATSAKFWLHASIFDSVISIDARLDMIETALNYRSSEILKDKPDRHKMLWEPLLVEWKRVRTRVRKKYDKRNEIAHSEIIHRGMQDGSQMTRLLAFPTLTKFSLGQNQKLLSVQQLEERLAAFREVSNEVVVFQNKLARLLRPPS
jgi:hypothetical protein